VYEHTKETPAIQQLGINGEPDLGIILALLSFKVVVSRHTTAQIAC